MKKFSKIINILISIVIVILLVNRLPHIIKQYQSQGLLAAEFSVKTLSHGEFNLLKNQKPLAIVFWATWCGPCEVELKRIQNLINIGKIKPEDVLAISSNEEPGVITQSVNENKYTFMVGLDEDGSIFNLYKVAATPTIVLINSENKIKWMTTGLSPTLELRLLSTF